MKLFGFFSAKKIVPWLRIILRSPALLDEFYEPWAHVVQPGREPFTTNIDARNFKLYSFLIRI
jgi:hypothetical protein